MDQKPQNSIYVNYSKSLYRITGAEQTDAILNMLNSNPSQSLVANSVTVPAETFGSGVDTSTGVTATGSAQAGKKTYDNTVPGYILGVDPKDGNAKFFIGNTTSYFNWDGTMVTVAGTITATSGTIGGYTIGATSITAAANSSAFKTAASGTRVEITNNQVNVYSGSIIRIQLANDTLQVYDSLGNASTTIRDTEFTVPNCGIQDIGGATYPVVTTTHNLGLSNRRWNTVYCVNADQSSDRRVKEDVAPVGYGLDAVKKISPVRFKFHFPNQEKRDEYSLGIIAQELYSVIPEVTRECSPEGEVGAASISYTELIPVLIQAIKDLSVEVDSLKAKIGI